MLVMQQYLLRHIGAEQALSGAARLRAADRARAAEVPRGPADLPLPGRAAVRPGAAGAGRRGVEARRPRRPRPRAGEHRADPAPGEVGRRSRGRCRCGWTSSSAPAGAARRAGPGASGRRASCSAATRDAAAAGWGGDRYELWQRGACAAPPCRDDDVLVMKWRWDTREDAREFEAAAARVARSRAVPPCMRAATPSRSCWRGDRGARAPHRLSAPSASGASARRGASAACR